MLPHIFERYQKAERTNSVDNEGLGLGWAIVKKILEVHEINIDVKSTKDTGTLFSFKVSIFKAKQRIDNKFEYS